MLILRSDWYHQYSDAIHSLGHSHHAFMLARVQYLPPTVSPSPPHTPPPPLPSPPLPPRFYHLFPALAEGAMDSLLDLVEEENDQVREGGGGKYLAEVLLMESVSDNTLPPPSLPPSSLPPSLPPSLSSFSPSLSSLPPSLPQIRRTAIKALPDICKYSSDPSLCTKVAEYLTQLLATGIVTTHTITHSHPHTHIHVHLSPITSFTGCFQMTA